MIRFLEIGMFPVYIGFCSTDKEYKNQLKKSGLDPIHDFIATPQSSATLHSFVSTSGQYIMLMCVDIDKANKQKRTPIEVVGLMAHESVHAWQRTRDHIGEDNTKETEAYFIQYVSQFFMECFEEVSKKRMKWGKY